MKIECILKRKGGTKIELFGKNYHFKPEDAALKQDDPAYMEAQHVCEIDDDSAIHRLCVGIKEGYKAVDPNAAIPKPTKTVNAQTIINSQTGKVVEPAKPIIITDGEGAEINLSAMEPEALRALAKNTFEINVHHKWPDSTVIAKIVEKTRGEN